MTTQPLVSIICLCYNHERFLQEALDSVLAQTYQNIEVIVVDDCSTDGSMAIIEANLQKHPQLKFISTGHNRGNCTAFNIGLQASLGEYIIDFATDDVLLPERVAQQVATFQKLDKSYGIVYSDAEYISDDSEHLYYHSQKYKPAPNGDVFSEVLRRYFICSPTMMVRRSVFDFLGGYDENLYYEDFDFWVRSARKYKYHYMAEVTTRRRIHSSSMSSKWYSKGDRHLASHVLILEKALELIQTPEEKAAMITRLKYEVRQTYFSGNFKQAAQMLLLLHQVLPNLPAPYRCMELLNKYKVNLSVLRKLYYRLRYRNP
ncbi:glycosyltransferase [Pontibacter sp. H249]|uniref:glycosyltransferase n=1 Tax=Pontibacter sp. H249 TaxID=3133420 RepID=UPI0030BEA859